MFRPLAAATLGAAVVASLAAASTTSASAVPAAHHRPPARHVLLISVDGLHASDLRYWVERHPRSALARLAGAGVTYSHARTTFPSDSFPGMVAQVTGGTPGTTGVYYDDTYNHQLLPPGTTSCATATPGTEVAWTEAADRSHDPITLDAGQGLSSPALAALPTNTLQQTLADGPAITRGILGMTATPQALLDPATLPVDPATCLPVYPHDYVRTNTIFEVARAHGLRTAWSDKHAAYEILSGPSGTGVQDLFTPEINSVADAAGDDWTTNNRLTQEYDGTKVAAVLNEIDGYDHSGTRRVGTPAIFGLNFQSVSTAQKLPLSNGQAGGYGAGGAPGPVLTDALGYVDAQVGRLLARIAADGLQGSTTVVLSAKHGQSPIDASRLRRVDDGKIIDGLDEGWASAHPGAPALVAFSTDDDVMLLSLSDRSPAAQAFVRHYLLTHAAPANTVDDPKGTYSTSVAASGLTAVYTGAAADHYVGARVGDPHVPDVIGLVQPGVVYTAKTSKIAEHGGASADDEDVALVVSGAGVHGRGRTNGAEVHTTQIAPTILALLGLSPRALQAVRIDGTRVLPNLGAR